ncbi:hypothetical protein [Cupriavidus necator]
MVIAMIPMGVMQMIANQIVYMVAVRYGLMAAARAVPVVRVMAAALMVGGTPIRIGVAYCKHVLIDVIAVHVVEVAVMQIVNMSLMTHGDVAAIGPVLVRVIGGVLQRAVSHGANSLMDFRVRNPVNAVAQRTGRKDCRPATYLLDPRSRYYRMQARSPCGLALHCVRRWPEYSIHERVAGMHHR